jgi:hypothetical protein
MTDAYCQLLGHKLIDKDEGGYGKCTRCGMWIDNKGEHLTKQ